MIKHHVKHTNMEFTPAISDYLGKKMSALEKFVPSDTEAIARIEVGRTSSHHHKGDVYKAEINLEIGKDRFRAVSETADLYASIDEMRDLIMNEVSRAKRKRFHLLRRGAQKIKNIMRFWKRD